MAKRKLPARKNISSSTVKENLNKLEKIKSEIKNNSNNYIEINISNIENPKYHDRRYIDKYSIVELSQNINAVGLISPIVVRKVGENSYERIIGYRRIEAFKLLKKEKIPSIILENISDEQAILFMTSENLQREELSIYDETLAILDYIAIALEIRKENAIKLIHRYKNYTNGKTELSDIEKSQYHEVEEILAKTGKITIGSIVNRLSMLNFHDLIKTELSSGKLSYSVAKVINILKDESNITEVLKIAIEKNYSKTETQKLVKEYLSLTTKKDVAQPYSSIIKKINNKNINKLDDKSKEQLNDLLNQIDQLLKS